MNLRGAKELIYNGNKHSRAYFNYRLVWQKLKPGAFAKDFKYLESSEKFEGIWYREKGALVVPGGTGGTVGAIKAFGDYFTEKVDYGDLDYLLELDLNTFKTGRWISKTYAKLDNVYLQSSYLRNRLDFYYKKDDGFYVLRQTTLEELKGMLGG